ncbi:MAG: hypothetical protein HYW27_02390 [Candidatus Aenigmarchaeota archaeon]|nr:hypothetical protein [Candidatus Aenigmarchaeota archaeon]
MKIDETISEKNVVMEKDDPYGFSMKLMDRMSEFGHVTERRNEYMTDGPEHRSFVEFDVVDVMDDFSRIQVSVFMDSVQKTLSMRVICSFDVKADESGFMSSMLSEYYVENIYPAVRRMSLEKIKAVEKFIESGI